MVLCTFCLRQELALQQPGSGPRQLQRQIVSKRLLADVLLTR